ncbi:MAG: arginine--tRNA ligase [Elusimicrobiota bacterium]
MAIFNQIKNLVYDQVSLVLSAKGKVLNIPAFDLTVPPSKVPGDVATNVVLMVAKEAKENPKKLAEEIAAQFPTNELVSKVEIAGPGFLNFWLTDLALQSELFDLVSGNSTIHSGSKEKILLEFVSANPTGPLHVGHGRGAALGDSLARIFKYLGHEVICEFYINDSGGQIRKLGLSTEARYKEIKGEAFDFPEEGYKGSYVKDIAQDIIDSKLHLKTVTDSQMVFDETDFAGYASSKNLKVIQESLKNFGVHFDEWYPESRLHKSNKVLSLLKDLQKKDLAYEQEGAVWFKATQFGDEKDRVLKKGNEAPTYFASDIAYHVEKFDRKLDKYINIWGADHHGYAQRLKGALKAIGFESDRLEVIFNQLVSIKGGRLSKRAGDMVTLQELVEEVGKDAARFFFALRGPGTHFEFDLDLAKKQASDNPVFYVQYVHARCRSIFREAEKRGLSTDVTFWKNKPLAEKVADAEKDVLLHLASFDKVVELCAKDRSNHHLTVYLLELAGKYHSFYEKCHVLVEDPVTRSFRLALVESIRKRVAEGLELLGVSAPESL